MKKILILIFALLTFNVFDNHANSFVLLSAEANESALSILPDNSDSRNISEELQQNKIAGTVSDQKGSPLAGVTVLIKGTTLGVTTDAEGKYTITNPPQNAILTFSFIGMKIVEESTSGKTQIDVVMQEETTGLDEVVIVGYGTQKRTTITGSVSVMKGDVVANVPVPNVTNSLAGRVTGVIMRPTSGQPGQDNPDIYIRGISTTGSSVPLIVIDGVIRDNLSQLDPNIIASVSVLKDAAAVAPYGLAGANGVILITTKKGAIGTPKLSIDTYWGWMTPTYVPHVLDAKNYMILQNEAYFNDNPGGANKPWEDDVINNYATLHAEDPDRYANSNTLDLMIMKAPVKKHNMQLSGGTEKARYFAGLGYYKQDGLFERTNYDRYNYNLNVDLNVTKTTLVSASIVGSSELTNDLDPEYTGASMFRALYKYYPMVPIYYTNGLWGQSAANSPAGVINSESYLRDKGNTNLTSISIEQQLPFIKGLSIKGAFSYDMRDNFVKGWHTPWYYWTQDLNTTPYTYTKTAAGLEGVAQTFLRETQTHRKYYTYQGFINYSRSFGRHTLTGLLVAEARNSKYDSFFAQRNNFAVNVDELDMGSSNKTDFDNGGSSSVGAQIGYVYRFGYVYNDKYMFEATGRYDGHYYFAPGSRWGYFPAFSAGWRISNENFMKNIEFINNLKIRGSWGQSGNLAGEPYQYLSGYTLEGNGYAFGTGTMVQRAFNPLEANPNITWEKSSKTNIGFEATLWNSLLMLEADYFFENRKDMLMSPAVTVPYEYGLTLAEENAGEMENQGFELRIGSKKDFSNGLTLQFDGNLSYAKNKMVQVFETSATYDNPNRRRTGRPFLTPFGFKSMGLFRLSDDINGDGIINSDDGYNVTQFGELHPGDIKYADLSGPNGVPDGVIDNNDETALGYPAIPMMAFGFTASAAWKGFDLNLFFQGSGLVSLDVGTFETVAFQNNKSNCEYEYFNNRWNPDKDATAIYPRANLSPSANNTANTDFWLMNTAHLRLKTAMFGYTIPANVLQFLKIDNIRVYFSGQNLVTFSKLKYKDPETAAYGDREAVAYPNMKSYTFGANITF